MFKNNCYHCLHYSTMGSIIVTGLKQVHCSVTTQKSSNYIQTSREHNYKQQTNLTTELLTAATLTDRERWERRWQRCSREYYLHCTGRPTHHPVSLSQLSACCLRSRLLLGDDLSHNKQPTDTLPSDGTVITSHQSTITNCTHKQAVNVYVWNELLASDSFIIISSQLVSE